jgi:hypothetical protein
MTPVSAAVFCMTLMPCSPSHPTPQVSVSIVAISAKATTLLLVVGLLGLLAVTACLADPLPHPGGGVMDPQAGPGAPTRLLLNHKHKGGHKQHDGHAGGYCWYKGHRYTPHSYHHGYYCCYGKWTIHKCN